MKIVSINSRIAAFVLALPPMVMAERADREMPVDIKGREIVIDQANGSYELRGSATLTQGTMKITADRIVVREDAKGNRSAQLYGAPGAQVAFRQKRDGFEDYIEGFADRAEFDDASDTLKLFSNARLKSGADELRGEYIQYNSSTEVLKAGALPGAHAQSGTAAATGPGEAHITLHPRNRDGKAAADKRAANDAAAGKRP
jgi:lipopolysaccharide export system protein LptA